MAAFVRAASLGNYAEVAAARRASIPSEMIRGAGLDPAFLADPDLRIPTAAVVALLEESARESGCPTFGLQMAESWRMSDFGAISLLLTHQRTLRDALEATIRYRHLLNDSLSLSIEDAGDLVIVREELVGEGARALAPGDRARDRRGLPDVPRAARARTGGRSGVQLRPRRPAATSRVHRRIFGRTLEFEQRLQRHRVRGRRPRPPQPVRRPGDGGLRAQLRAIRCRARATPARAQEVRRAILIAAAAAARRRIEQIAQGAGHERRARCSASSSRRASPSRPAQRGAARARAALPREPRLLAHPGRASCWATTSRARSRAGSWQQFGKSPARWRASTRAARANATAR